VLRDSLQFEYELLLARHFADWAEDELFEAHGSIEEDELGRLAMLGDFDISERAKSDVLDPYLDQVEYAFSVITERLKSTNPHDIADEDAFLGSINDYNRSPQLFDLAFAQLKREAPPSANSWTGYTAALLDSVPIANAGAVQTRDRRRDDAEAKLRQAKQELKEAESDVVEAERAFAASSRPEGLGKTVAALAYLTLASLVFPLALMAWGREHLPWAARAAVVVAFFSGLAVFFLELRRLARSLSKEPDEAIEDVA
jgi:hypothetical protein